MDITTERRDQETTEVAKINIKVPAWSLHLNQELVLGQSLHGSDEQVFNVQLMAQLFLPGSKVLVVIHSHCIRCGLVLAESQVHLEIRALWGNGKGREEKRRGEKRRIMCNERGGLRSGDLYDRTHVFKEARHHRIWVFFPVAVLQSRQEGAAQKTNRARATYTKKN